MTWHSNVPVKNIHDRIKWLHQFRNMFLALFYLKKEANFVYKTIIFLSFSSFYFHEQTTFLFSLLIAIYSFLNDFIINLLSEFFNEGQIEVIYQIVFFTHNLDVNAATWVNILIFKDTFTIFINIKQIIQKLVLLFHNFSF
ncbi:hypothetical protein BpHYR1_006886 [Brachionus plicatilis]|uniref:Uncharacterized protein n=1 Tax=Brachionus plicatilis TaxID=10195 RepID=A0A3M7T9B9_BRAPC|nr:hypothetical protein BpHYR1_006886 [Brachionus plicatilis]